MKKVIVAEDERTTRTLIAKIVEKAGYIPIQCSDGERALRLIEDNPDIELLITDIVMPNMNGKQLIEALRFNPATKNLPIIITSGVIGVDEIAQLLKQGADYYVPKPIPASELLGYLELTLDPQKAHKRCELIDKTAAQEVLGSCAVEAL